MWKNCFAVLVIGLSMAIGACIAQDDARRDDQVAQVDRSAAGITAQAAGEELEAAFDTQHFSCNGNQPGLPIPISREDEFSACMPACLDGPFHPTFGSCWGSCCRQVTGCSQCFEQ
jgi:hypothetical protein